MTQFVRSGSNARVLGVSGRFRGRLRIWQYLSDGNTHTLVAQRLTKLGHRIRRTNTRGIGLGQVLAAIAKLPNNGVLCQAFREPSVASGWRQPASREEVSL